jgi:outer membrane protein W
MKSIMVSTMFAIACLAFAPPARAQGASYQPIRVDLTVYGAYASADANAYGIGAAVEPKYNLTDHLALGLRFEGAAFATQAVSVGPTGSQQVSVSQSARALTAYLVKADYYLTTSYVRPFVGLGLGLYRIASGSQSISGTGGITQQASSFSGFGLCPQVGVNFGSFRLAGTYHVITGKDQVVVTQAVGGAPTEVKLSKSFFAFEIGGTFGGAPR